MQRRVLAAFLAACLLLSLTPVTALAEEDVLSSPDRYTDVSLEDAVAYLRGSGTQDDPFQIWNADDLYYINYLEYWRGQEEGEVPVYHYLQMADIDLSSADRFDKGTGYITANFAGVYDGGGHALTGMDKPLFYFTKGTYVGDGAGTVFTDYVSGESHDKVFSAIVRNLTLSEPAITQTVATDVIEQMGAVAAYAVNTAFYNIRVEGGEINGVSGAASIAGRAGSVVIDTCSSNADVYASMHRAAGIVSNLRIVDAKKGATSTSLVTNCTFSGTVSGNLDGERGSAGIVGAVYMDGTSELNNGGGLPLYVSDCTFSGTVSGTVTSGSGNFGGILGTSYLGPGLNLKNNVVTGTIENISVQGAGTAANVGGIVGKTLNYSLLGRELTLVLENNDVGKAVLPDSNPGEKLYVGTLIGCQYDANRVTTGPISISTTESLGLYGNIQGAQFSGEIGALTLPECQGSVEFFILEGATVESLTVNTTGTLKIHNAGTLGNVTNKMGVTIADNTGTIENVTSLEGTVLVTGNQGEIGNLTSAGTITVGASAKTQETAAESVGNEGVLGDLLAGGSVTIYRNAQDAKIGGVTSQTGSVTIGQSDSSTEAVRDYNVNAGTIGSVTAATSVNIRSTAQGSVAAGEGELVKAGTTVTIGTSALLNEGGVGTVTAGDSTGTTVTVYNTGTLGDIEAKTSSVTIGQGNNASADVQEYNVNSGSIGSVSAATSVAIHSSAQGSVAMQSGQSVSAGTSVAIGSEQNANANDIGPVQCQTTSSLYNGTGSVSSLTSGGTATVYVQEGSAGLNVITTDADVKIEDRTQSSAPSVNVTTGGGDVRVARAEGDTNPILAKVNLTVTEGLLEGQTLFVRGAFASLTHKGAGDVIMESADTSVANLIKLGTGDVKEFGETGSVTTPDEAQECLLSLVPVSHDSLEVYLLSAKGLPLDKGSWSNTQVEGGVFTPAAGIVAGGGTAEKLGTVAVETAQAGELEVTVSGTYIPEQGEGMLLTASLKVTIPALVERVDTVLLTSADEFEAAADQYAWQQTAQPQDYPVLAVMPVVSEAYSDITPTVNGQDVTEDGVLLVAVDAARALDEGVIEVQVAAQGENAPGYSQSVSYSLTEADRAKLDTQKEYYYITYRYMDGTTKDKTVPVEKGQTGETEAPGQREGYTFLGWRGDNDRLYSAGSEVTPEADMVMTAEWGADSTVYTLTISVTGGGSVVRVEDGQEHDIASGTGFLEGDQVVLRAKRATGYRFAGWTVDGESFDEEEITVTMDDNVTVKATFRRISSGGAPSGGSSGGSVTTYAIAVGSVENGTVECISKEAKGNEVLVTLTPDEGYEVGSLQVVKDSGGEVSVTKRGDGEYLFTMPGEAVRVIAAFVEAQEEADEWNNPFADVAEGAWYYDAVAYASQNGLMNGVSADSFAPDATTSRGMIVTILYRLEDSPSAAQADFADVAAGAYYAGAVAWASANGIVTGYGDGTFGPDTAITREQLAAILYRYAQYLGLEVSQTADLTGYGDAADISEWAQQAFAWAVREGLISGMDDGTLAPQGTATRAQVATILMRLCEKLEG